MFKHLASALAMFAVLGLVSCGSPSPTGPTTVATAGGAMASEARFSKPDASAAIVIDKGELDFDVYSNGQLYIEGNRGFSVSATVSKTAGIFTPYTACRYTNCMPGDPIPLYAVWVGNDFNATVTLDGTTYHVGPLAFHASAQIQFLGTAMAPPLTNRGEDQITAPFTMTGSFHAQNGVSINESFSGAGIARLWLVRTSGGPGWFVERVLYRFKHPKASTNE
jgi:hypothetical protein